MTRERIFGSDTAFCDWLRSCPELPSIGPEFGLSASDNDVTLHRFLQDDDRLGIREIQAIMQIEIKTRQGKPPSAQLDTLSKLNEFRGQKVTTRGLVRFFGVFFLVLSDTTPDNSKSMWWGRIPKVTNDTDDLRWSRIQYATLIKILRFDVHPNNLLPRAFRRHHATKEIVEVVQYPLGFSCEKPVVKRS